MNAAGKYVAMYFADRYSSLFFTLMLAFIPDLFVYADILFVFWLLCLQISKKTFPNFDITAKLSNFRPLSEREAHATSE